MRAKRSRAGAPPDRKQHRASFHQARSLRHALVRLRWDGPSSFRGNSARVHGGVTERNESETLNKNLSGRTPAFLRELRRGGRPIAQGRTGRRTRTCSTPGKEIPCFSSPSPLAAVTLSNEPCAERSIEEERPTAFAANRSRDGPALAL
jgi:hypothetical protein